jgi:hypothetical protein
MNPLFILVLIGLGISINGYATVGSRAANAEYFNIRLSNGTTVCAQNATTLGKNVIYLIRGSRKQQRLQSQPKL